MTDRTYWKPEQMLEAICKRAGASSFEIEHDPDDQARSFASGVLDGVKFKLEMSSSDPLQFAVSRSIDEPIKGWANVKIKIVIDSLKMLFGFQANKYPFGRSPHTVPEPRGVDIYGMKTPRGLRDRAARSLMDTVAASKFSSMSFITENLFDPLGLRPKVSKYRDGVVFKKESAFKSPCGTYKYDVVADFSRPRLCNFPVDNKKFTADEFRDKFYAQGVVLSLRYWSKPKNGKGWKRSYNVADQLQVSGDWHLTNISDMERLIPDFLSSVELLRTYDFSNARKLFSEEQWSPREVIMRKKLDIRNQQINERTLAHI